jgi:putative peptide zinc metalloprotease protein
VIPTTSSSGADLERQIPSEGNSKPSKDAIFERVSQLPIGLRSDLEVSRQIINGKVQYVIRDPLTFSSCSLSQEDYQVFLHLEPNRSVGHSYQRLAEAGILGAEQRSDFYQFIIDLHRRNLIRLPILDGDSLFQDLEARPAREQASLSDASPLLPNAFAQPRSFSRKHPAICRTAFPNLVSLVWIALAAIALSIVMVRWTEFIDSTSSILALRSLPILVLILCGLKLFHELGHAYACKLYGGNVPEMGMILIIGIPCRLRG